MTLPADRIKELESNLLLIYTGITRFASSIAMHQIRNIHNRTKELAEMRGFVDTAVDILDSTKGIEQFGRLLHKSWQVKKKLSEKITNETIDSLYIKAMHAGALGGKILGAGSGGFMLLFVTPDKRKSVTNALRQYMEVKFIFENHGSQIIHYNHEPE